MGGGGETEASTIDCSKNARADISALFLLVHLGANGWVRVEWMQSQGQKMSMARITSHRDFGTLPYGGVCAPHHPLQEGEKDLTVWMGARTTANPASTQTVVSLRV